MTPLRRKHAALQALIGLFIVLVMAGLFAVGPAATAHADTSPTKVAQSLLNDPVYVASHAKDRFSGSELDSLRSRVQQADTPIYIAVLPAGQLGGESAFKAFTSDLRKAVRQNGTYAVVADGRIYAVSNVLPGKEVRGIAEHVAASNDTTAALAADFVNELSQVSGSGGEAPSASSSTPANGADSGPPWGGLIVLIVLLGGGALWYGSSRYKRHQLEQKQLERVRHVADEDVTRLGEDIAALDLDVTSQQIDGPTRLDYQRALDSYDSAKRRLETARRPEGLRPVSTALEDGRYQLACVRARMADEPLPERRAPCFFDPQHGPSVTDMDWAPPGGRARSIPVCRADADRLRHGEEPSAREVYVHGKRRPYWEAGPSLSPWFGGYYGGYYGAGGLMGGLLVGTMLGSALDAEQVGHGGGFDGGFGGGGDGGAGGGGGFDGGGGGFGGGFGGGGGGF